MRTYRICCVLVILFCELFTVSWCGLPKEIQKCNSTNNTECIPRTIEQIFKLYPHGNPEFGMPDVSALNLTNFKISKSNADSPIQINFEFLQCTVNGIENAKITKTAGFDKELKHGEFQTIIPTIRMVGDYLMNGKILLLPINGKGKGELELRDVKLVFKGGMNKEVRNNKTYFKLKKFKSTIEPKLLIVNLENLFNGNPVLSKTLNDVINENWKEVFTELQDGINHAIETVIGSMCNAIFSTLSVDEIYAD